MTKDEKIKEIKDIIINNSIHTETTSDGWIITLEESQLSLIADDILNGFADVV